MEGIRFFCGVQSSHRSPDDVGDDPDGRWIPLERIFREINGFCHVSCVKLYYEQTVYLQEEKDEEKEHGAG